MNSQASQPQNVENIPSEFSGRKMQIYCSFLYYNQNKFRKNSERICKSQEAKLNTLRTEAGKSKGMRKKGQFYYASP